ncbi:MAG TPA: hypothetical protein VNC50_14540 [Planctomycetia bacterium]|nr:hypothetical protein [Planctomycetia bacterium]
MTRGIRNAAIVAALFAGALALRSPADAPKQMALKADDVVKLWSPRMGKAKGYHATGGSPEVASDVAAFSFRVKGVTLEELWNHYAERCGTTTRFKPKNFLISASTGPKGSYVISDQMSADGKGTRGVSVFMLKTDEYAVTVSFLPDADGKSICGSIAAVVR